MHTRLLAANLAQFIISFLAAIVAFFLGREIIHSMYPSEPVPQVSQSQHSEMSFLTNSKHLITAILQE